MASDSDKDRVRAGWALTATLQPKVARSFYAHLFRIAPETQSLFKGDMDLQGRKLTETLSFIVDHLDEPETLLPAARDLAVRHASYGVQPDHYDQVGAALLQTLEDLLGAGFTPQDRQAWGAVYGELSGVMLEAVPG